MKFDAFNYAEQNMKTIVFNHLATFLSGCMKNERK